MLVVVAAQHLLDKFVEVAVMAEHDMSAMVPNKAVLIGVAGSKSANVVVALEHFPIFVTEFGEPICCTEPRGSRADNDDFLAHNGLPFLIYLRIQHCCAVDAKLEPSADAL